MTRALDISLATAALFLLAAPAWADVIVAPDGTIQPVEDHRALLVHQGRSQTVIEELFVDSRVDRLLWIKAVPSEPKASEPAEDPFAVLDGATRVLEPHNESVRARVFGPSVVTLLVDRLLRDEARPPAEDEPAPVRSLEITQRRLFSGTVYTSTITREYVLPEPMQSWLHGQGFTLPTRVIADLSAHLNRGAQVALTVAKDPAPGSPGQGRLGPVQMTLPAASPLFPILRRSDAAANRTRYEVFVVGSAALVPSAYSTLWDEEPWVKKATKRGQFHTVYAHPLEDTSQILLEIEQRLGVPMPSTPNLVRSTFRQGTEALGEIYFEPGKYVVQIPDSGRRGDPLDLFLCVLLGLTPLIYTPESWFFLWLGARARDRRRLGQSAFGHRLWPLFSLAVAIYWGVTLDEIARLAAVLPLLLAIGMLSLPDGLRQETRVRVDFSRKKKSKPNS